MVTLDRLSQLYKSMMSEAEVEKGNLTGGKSTGTQSTVAAPQSAASPKPEAATGQISSNQVVADVSSQALLADVESPLPVTPKAKQISIALEAMRRPLEAEQAASKTTNIAQTRTGAVSATQGLDDTLLSGLSQNKQALPAVQAVQVALGNRLETVVRDAAQIRSRTQVQLQTQAQLQPLGEVPDLAKLLRLAMEADANAGSTSTSGSVASLSASSGSLLIFNAAMIAEWPRNSSPVLTPAKRERLVKEFIEDQKPKTDAELAEYIAFLGGGAALIQKLKDLSIKAPKQKQKFLFWLNQIFDALENSFETLTLVQKERAEENANAEDGGDMKERTRQRLNL